jgi:hypothetical protein
MEACIDCSSFYRSRQLRHMSSSAYKAPVYWYQNEENKELDELPRMSLYKTRLQKARHQIRHSIVQTGFTWLQDVGLILGGYDKLWQLSRWFSEQVTTSANAMPGRVICLFDKLSNVQGIDHDLMSYSFLRLPHLFC